MNREISGSDLGFVVSNIATLLKTNAEKFAKKPAIAFREGGEYSYLTWNDLYRNVRNIAAGLRSVGFSEGNKCVLFSVNSPEMLQIELAVMALGGVAVPIFSGFKSENAQTLILHSRATFLYAGNANQAGVLTGIERNIHLITQEDFSPKIGTNATLFPDLLSFNAIGDELRYDASSQEVCLNMYTSGTMGIPKCVQLTHRNILSQQAALRQIWQLDESSKMLGYLPWHHSFGGIFELFAALYNGATFYIESGQGKDLQKLLENWKLVKPTMFFSVPKVYQTLLEACQTDPAVEASFFHKDLSFIFTAAASLPQHLSKEFEKRNIPIYEGWGLTETSPCCTVTDPSKPREPGVVGFPIPGVTLRLADDGEILVKGPNVMAGYFENEEANRQAFTEDGWFKTGDVGEFTENGLKLVCRKDRIFKLVNGEKVIPSDMEAIIQGKCHYILHALVTGSGEEYPVALLFPNTNLLNNPSYQKTIEDGCFCPRDLNELGKCLRGCLHDANCAIEQRFSRVRYAMILNDDLSVEANTLTPSLKMAPGKVASAYKGYIQYLYEPEKAPIPEREVYIIPLQPEKIPQTEQK